MRNAIKIELYKAIHNKYFVLALLIAFIIQMFNFMANLEYYKLAMTITPGFGYPSHEDTFSIMVFWLGADNFSMGATLAKYMLPIIAVLPYGWSFISEIRNGYQNNMLCRLSRTQYFIAKYIAVFISGGTIPAFMLVSNLAVNALIGVLRTPYPYTLVTTVLSGVFCSELYYTNPIIFLIIWTGIAFLWGGVFAGTTLLLGMIFKKSVFVLSFPFLFALVMDSLCGTWLESKWSFMDNYFVSSAVMYDHWIIFVEIFLIFAVGFGGGLITYRIKEAL